MQAEPLDLTTQSPAPSPSGASTASSLNSEDSQHQERQASELNKSANTSAPDLLCKVCNGGASGFHFGKLTTVIMLYLSGSWPPSVIMGVSC